MCGEEDALTLHKNMTFIYEKALSLPEALALFGANSGRFPILAGGTDIVVQWRSGVISPKGIIDISAVDELKKIEETDDAIEIGALATHTAIASNPLIMKHVRVLSDACKTIGASQIQNRGTIGGNVMNASPAGDTLPVALAMDAEFLAQNLKGERWIPAAKFYVSYKKTALATDELLTRIRFPKMEKGEVARFMKIGTRRAQSISKISMCVSAKIWHGGIEKIAIAVGSVAPTVIRAPGTEMLLKGKAINTALIDKARHSIMDEVHPIDDVRSTADYRRFVCGNLITKFLQDVIRKIK